MLDIRILKDFLALARLGNFSRAAEHCNVTTSGLSRRIAMLEAWLGTPVLERGRHPLQLTDAGHEFRDVAAQMVATLEATRTAIQRKHNDGADLIRIAAPHILSRAFFPAWLQRLHQQFGDARLSITSADLPDCLHVLQAAEADFLVTFSDPLDSIGARLPALRQVSALPRVQLGTERLVPVSAPGISGGPLHALGRTQPAISFLPYSDNCSLGWIVENHLRHRHDLPRLLRHHDSSLAEGLTAMALVGLGIAWLPLGCVWNDLERGHLVRAGDDAFDISLEIHLLRRHSALGTRAQALWNALTTTPPVPAAIPESPAGPNRRAPSPAAPVHLRP
jgi:DNA-binding transcriptional LysR family regulator